MSHNYFVKRILSVILAVCLLLSVVWAALPGVFPANAVTKGVSLADAEESGYES